MHSKMRYLKTHNYFEEMKPYGLVNTSFKKRLDDIIEHEDQETLDFYIKNGEINVNDYISFNNNVLEYLISNCDDVFYFDLSTVIEYTNNINHKDEDGFSAFMISVYYNHFEYSKQLLKYNIDLNIVNNDDNDFTKLDLNLKYINIVVDYIKKEYHEKWKKYLRGKQAKKFKI